jgi:hypothetical protein
MLSLRAVSETFWPHSSYTRWICSQRTRSADMGLSGGAGLDRGWAKQCSCNVVGVSGLGQIVDRTVLHCGDGCGDVAVAREDDNACIRAGLVDDVDNIQAIARLTETEIHHCKSRRRAARDRHGFIRCFCSCHDEPACFHGARETLTERGVIINEEQ